METAIEFVKKIVANLDSYGFPFLVFFIGVLEFSFGLYKRKWPKNEKFVDIACFTLPRLIIRPAVAYYSLKLLPLALPAFKNEFGWVPLFWGLIIIAVADDLTQYWYHRLHHEIPWLWRFHRTFIQHFVHGDGYIGRQNAIYTLFFSNLFNRSFGLYGLRGAGHYCAGHKRNYYNACSFKHPWDKPFINIKCCIRWPGAGTPDLNPGTHHAHHAATIG